MPKQTKLTKEIEQEFARQIDRWFSEGMSIWDNDLDRQIAKWYSEVEDVYPSRPYFSPSSLNSCPRELYLKAKGFSRDNNPIPPYQGRWQCLGGYGGDMMQRELLMMERHYNKVTGDNLKFRFERDEQGRPMFEDFAKKSHPIAIDGELFYLFGAPDGVMIYTTDEGEEIRVGLEVKSKQTTNARTSKYSMREAEEDHVVQTIAYSEMYDCEYYMIVYVNYSKRGWVITEEQYESTPDLRVFCNQITPQDKFETFLYASTIQKMVKSGEIPKLNIMKWTFNNYKEACAKSLSLEELSELETSINELLAGPIKLKPYEVNNLKEIIPEIMQLRSGK